jgi:elongation factor G
MKAVADEYHDKLMDVVAETSDELMERYLEGDEITREEMAAALKKLVTEGEIFPVGCGAATRNIGTHGLLDLIVEGLPSPARARNVPEVGGASTLAYVFKTIADPYSGKINLLRVFAGTLTSDSTLTNNHTHTKERVGQLLTLQGKDHAPVDSLPCGAIGAVAKLKETGTGDVLSDVDSPAEIEPLAFPSPVVSFAIEPKSKGDEEKVHTSLRRLQEEDPSLDVHRDAQTGETIVAGLSQMHVEVTLERMARRFGVEVTLHPPRVPYMETIRKPARAQGRYKKQTGGRGQFGDCHITLEPLANHEGYEFVDKIVGGVIPQGFRPAVDKGIQEAMQQGELARCPVVGIRATLTDGSYHTVDSSEMAFKIAGSMAFKKAFAEADPVLLEPIVRLDISVPDESVGDVIGDMTSRRGRVGGMDPAGGSTTIHVEVPLAEVLTYAPDLTSMTGGRGDYQMTLLRYEEVPAHVAQQVIAAATKEKELANA